jgi:hypothetical protein
VVAFRGCRPVTLATSLAVAPFDARRFAQDPPCRLACRFGEGRAAFARPCQVSPALAGGVKDAPNAPAEHP